MGDEEFRPPSCKCGLERDRAVAGFEIAEIRHVAVRVANDQQGGHHSFERDRDPRTELHFDRRERGTPERTDFLRKDVAVPPEELLPVFVEDARVHVDRVRGVRDVKRRLRTSECSEQIVNVANVVLEERLTRRVLQHGVATVADIADGRESNGVGVEFFFRTDGQ